MNTKSASAAAAVIGARHLRAARNGQDAAAAWAGDAAGVAVVCDGCGAGASCEVGARIAASLIVGAVARRLAAGARVRETAMWTAVRRELVAQLARVLEAMPGERAAALHDHFLFTIVAAAWDGDEVAVWAVGDGAYALGAQATTLGPFADNEPPYVGYDLIDAAAEAHFVVADARCGSVLVATDGVAELGLAGFTAASAIERYVAHPDALRRQLALHARGDERIDWEERRVVRAPALLQDDGAIALLSWAERPA